MSDKEDDEIKLRDQIAIAAMEALLSQYKQHTNIVENKSGSNAGGMINTNNYINEYENENDLDYESRLDQKIEMISRLAYKIADQMRKARLTSFT